MSIITEKLLDNMQKQYRTISRDRLLELLLRFAYRYDKEFEQFFIEESGLYE